MIGSVSVPESRQHGTIPPAVRNHRVDGAAMPAAVLLLALDGLPWHRSRPIRKDTTVDKTELAKLETYLRRTFNNLGISVRARMKKTDSAEVYLGEEFIGIIHVDDEDGDRSFNFTMAILDVDLED
jgi:hypothetical protein